MKEKEKVYIETSVISYLTSFPSRDLIIAAHQQITKDWWEKRKNYFDIFISQFVIDEVSRGDKEAAKSRLEIISELPELIINKQVEKLSEEIIRSGAIPIKSAIDAAHIAIASVHNIHYLLTWNCKHIANAEIMKKVLFVCNDCGFYQPIICTPEELMGE